MAGRGSDRDTQGSGREPAGDDRGLDDVGARPIISHACTRSAIAARETQRRIKHGPIRPMVEPSFWERLFGLG